MSLFSPKYETPPFSCSPLWCLRKCHVLPEPDITAESRGVHISARTSRNLLTGFKETEIRLALQRLGRCQVVPMKDLQPFVVPRHIAERGFCCHLTQERLWRAGQNLWAESPPGEPSSSSSPSVNDAGRARAKLPWGWGSLGDASSAIRSADLRLHESQSYSWCPTESICVRNEVGSSIFITTVTQVRLALPLALTFLNTNIPGNQWFWEDPLLWIVANFRSDT